MIIPSINRATLEEAREDIEKAKEFLPPEGWLHLDVADGVFTPWKSWNAPHELKDLDLKMNVEAHLMVEDPQSVVKDWLEAGVKRLIVPIEKIDSFDELYKLAREYGAEVAPSFGIETPIADTREYESASLVNVLAVHPGESGQAPHSSAFEKVKFLREVLPGVKIEFDGGADLEVGKRALDAGADTLVSGHFIFESDNPGNAFKKLNDLINDVS